MIGFILFFVILCMLLYRNRKAIYHEFNVSMFKRHNRVVSDLLNELNSLDSEIENLDLNHKDNMDSIGKSYLLSLERLDSANPVSVSLNEKEYADIVQSVVKESLSKITNNDK